MELDWLSEELLNEIAEEFGDVLSEDITEEEMMTMFESTDDVLNEKNIVRFDRHTKLKTAGSKAAIILAHNDKHKFYYKMKAARRLHLKYKALIIKKYGARGLVAAKSSHGIIGLNKNKSAKDMDIDKQKSDQLKRVVR